VTRVAEEGVAACEHRKSVLRPRNTPERVEDWREYLCEAVGDEEATLLRQHARTGRPLGRERFLKKVEKRLGRELHRRKPGPKPRELRR